MKRLVVEDGRRGAVADNEGEFGRSQPKVEWYVDCADTHRGKENLYDVGTVEAEIGNAVSRLDPICKQSGRQCIDPTVKLSPSERSTGRKVEDGEAVWLDTELLVDPVVVERVGFSHEIRRFLL